MRATLLWVIIACVGASGLLAATKPTDAQAAQAISKTLTGTRIGESSALSPVSALAGIAGGFSVLTVTTVDSVEITRWGNYSDKDAYWPVETCVTALVHSADRVAGRQMEKRVSALMRFRVTGDDFGAWAVTEIPIEKWTQLSDQILKSRFVCQPTNRKP